MRPILDEREDERGNRRVTSPLSVDAFELKRIIDISSPGPVVVPGTGPLSRAKEPEMPNRSEGGVAERGR
ncbi:MAG: hypothetical protein ABI614_08610 [Planctomycetota bacterium]